YGEVRHVVLDQMLGDEPAHQRRRDLELPAIGQVGGVIEARIEAFVLARSQVPVDLLVPLLVDLGEQLAGKARSLVDHARGEDVTAPSRRRFVFRLLVAHFAAEPRPERRRRPAGASCAGQTRDEQQNSTHHYPPKLRPIDYTSSASPSAPRGPEVAESGERDDRAQRSPARAQLLALEAAIERRRQ